MRLTLFVGVFITALCSMYIGSYFLASKLYRDALEDLEIVTTVSERGPCPPFIIYILTAKFLNDYPLPKDVAFRVYFYTELCIKAENAINDYERDN